MKALIPVTTALCLFLCPPLAAQNEDESTGEVLPILFQEQTGDGRWAIVNDTVMGGVSSSSYEKTEAGTFIFRGDLSLENNGGFASVRSPLDEPDLTGADAFRLRVRGDGMRYQLRFRVRGDWSWVNYGQSFDTRPGEWIEVELPVEEFRPTWRGEPVTQAPPFDPARTFRIMLMASDKQEGAFQLEVDAISAVRSSAAEAESAEADNAEDDPEASTTRTSG